MTLTRGRQHNQTATPSPPRDLGIVLRRSLRWTIARLSSYEWSLRLSGVRRCMPVDDSPSTSRSTCVGVDRHIAGCFFFLIIVCPQGPAGLVNCISTKVSLPARAGLDIGFHRTILDSHFPVVSVGRFGGPLLRLLTGITTPLSPARVREQAICHCKGL
ncbi:hypothetical protein B0T10DRAFT_97263 [Thelonectria olida]|uniref:Uncharacterized protein n=1 Tax=Thelonectria olida TaxID=1576542 RepID=A0A9P9AIZ5_9HYPO|nr:hypothetical protein B0T10DRAFT_97263 [Thelonectria olida]